MRRAKLTRQAYATVILLANIGLRINTEQCDDGHFKLLSAITAYSQNNNIGTQYAKQLFAFYSHKTTRSWLL